MKLHYVIQRYMIEHYRGVQHYRYRNTALGFPGGRVSSGVQVGLELVEGPFKREG